MALRYITISDLPELRTPRLILRPIEQDDAQDVYDAIERSRDNFSRWFVWSRESNLTSVQQNIRETISAMIAGTEWHYAIFDKEEGFCGRIGLSTINHDIRSAELGYWLSEEFQGRGLMSEAVRTMLMLVFCGGESFQINAYADTENTASQRVLTKCGFREIDVIKHIIRHPERGWRDHKHYAIRAHVE
ncbi:MAG: GNAT family N-acetyltransferase [Capsulimonas sp.]|jgi:ribosomal-protein-serine acetyltransferase|uniref:GNAT family N-acetyltransferase n=1 Tax=Capsulimonas sp. TaxID=2494211 RepID=UPI0032644E1F